MEKEGGEENERKFKSEGGQRRHSSISPGLIAWVAQFPPACPSTISRGSASATRRGSALLETRRGSVYTRPRNSTSAVSSSVVPKFEDALLEADELVATKESLVENEPLPAAQRLCVMGLLQGMIDRLQFMENLPGATSIQDTSVKLETIPDGQDVKCKKEKLLLAANLVHFSLGHVSKVSKFSLERAWLQDTFTTILEEVEDSGSFSVLLQILEANERKVKDLPDSLEHVKLLKDQMANLKDQMNAEAELYKETARQWATNLIEQKKVRLKKNVQGAFLWIMLI